MALTIFLNFYPGAEYPEYVYKSRKPHSPPPVDFCRHSHWKIK